MSECGSHELLRGLYKLRVERHSAGQLHQKRFSPPPSLVTRPLILRCVSIIGAVVSFNILLSVIPLYASSAGAGDGVAGLANGAMLFAAVAGELATARLVARFGFRRALMAGLLLLGAPAFGLIASASVASIVTISVVRGLGFAITCVAGGALTASLLPPERRGVGLAIVGVAAGVPAIVALPLGVWLIGRVGYLLEVRRGEPGELLLNVHLQALGRPPAYRAARPAHLQP